MTLEEFSNEFDVLIDNARISGASVRSLNEYEKSVFLTLAQEQIVTAYYKSFELSEEARRYLKDLITTKSVSGYTEDIELHPNARCYKIESNVLFIIYEWCSLTSDKKCLSDKKVSVVPIAYDDLARILENPFRGPNKRRIIRVDIPENKDMTSELIIPSVYLNSDVSSIQYNYRYIRKPQPIILEDIGTESAGLRIDNKYKATNCELDSSLHRTILNIAVKLAIVSKTT